MILLLISGAILLARNFWLYRGDELPILRAAARLPNGTSANTPVLDHPTIFQRRTPWFIMHATLGLLCIFIAVALVRGGRPPVYPIIWMKLNFALLLLVVLMAVMVRNAGKLQFESLRPIAGALPAASRE